MRKREEEQSARLIRCGVGILLGGVMALAICCLFLLGASVAISSGVVGEGLIYQLTIVGCVLGGFGGGMFAARQCSGALLTGLAVGGVLFLLLLTIGTLFFQTIELEAGGIGLLCGGLCGGALAGLLNGGKGRPARKKYRKR
ncbi:TIGR04086 family membrane protein [uncultured Flavonifractor sp.]|uniref:TIGR04086 family membrane protein n=1 Tax=uncultured Flavonifractor sp. TaxID=1193534 RepID=UPI00262D4E2A|nr:TIGR04086 family membrane protein [uncultured Flavonifractor sp.]